MTSIGYYHFGLRDSSPLCTIIIVIVTIIKITMVWISCPLCTSSPWPWLPWWPGRPGEGLQSSPQLRLHGSRGWIPHPGNQPLLSSSSDFQNKQYQRQNGLRHGCSKPSWQAFTPPSPPSGQCQWKQHISIQKGFHLVNEWQGKAMIRLGSNKMKIKLQNLI